MGPIFYPALSSHGQFLGVPPGGGGGAAEGPGCGVAAHKVGSWGGVTEEVGSAATPEVGGVTEAVRSRARLADRTGPVRQNHWVVNMM